MAKTYTFYVRFHGENYPPLAQNYTSLHLAVMYLCQITNHELIKVDIVI